MIRLGNNEVLKTLTFVDADTAVNANTTAEGSTLALRERCSGELKMVMMNNASKRPLYNLQTMQTLISLCISLFMSVDIYA